MWPTLFGTARLRWNILSYRGLFLLWCWQYSISVFGLLYESFYVYLSRHQHSNFFHCINIYIYADVIDWLFFSLVRARSEIIIKEIITQSLYRCTTLKERYIINSNCYHSLENVLNSISFFYLLFSIQFLIYSHWDPHC